MLRFILAASIAVLGAGVAHADVGMKGSAKRLCHEAGYLPKTPEL
jgi:hypothetical protein